MLNPSAIDTEKWVDHYGDMMYRYTLIRVKDPDASEEIVQSTFLAALQSQSTFEGRSSEKSWLFGILKHKILDHFRELKKQKYFDLLPDDDTDPFENAYNSKGAWIKPPQSWARTPEQLAENTQLAQALVDCLDGMPEKFRRVFVLKEIEGADSAVICKEFEIQPTNLWVILHRARNQLDRCLETNWFQQ